MSDYEDRYQRVLSALRACDGCCLDSEEEREKVAREVVRRVWGQEDLAFLESKGPVYDGIPGTALPRPTVKLIGEDGNAHFILGRVIAALKRAGAGKSVTDDYFGKATSGDYDNLLRVTMEYVDIV